MPSNLESTPIGTAVAAFLLRAYGFKQKDIYEIMADPVRGIDMSIYRPSVGGAAHKNLSKALFTQPTRDRTGGSRGSPSWLPNGVRLGDHLATCLGFADEAALEDYTQNVVGALSFTPTATMGGTSAGSAQRNLLVAHWDWTGANASTVVNGDTGGTAPHSMGDALNDAHSNASFDLASLVAGGPPAPAPPATPPAPAPPVPEDPVAPATPDPIPPVGPSSVTTTPSTAINGRFDFDNPSALAPFDASPSWLSPISVDSMPTPARAVRRLNMGTLAGRRAGTMPDSFPGLPPTSNLSFYPAIGPVYIVLDTHYPGKSFGPGDDISIRSMTRIGDTSETYDWTKPQRPHYRMVIGLKRDKAPVFYLIDDSGNATDVYNIITTEDSDKSRNLGDSIGSTNMDFSIEWSDEGVAERIRFQIERSGARGGSMADFEIVRQDDGTYRFTDAPDNFVTNPTALINTMAAMSDSIDDVVSQRTDFVQAFDGGIVPDDSPSLVLLYDDNPLVPPSTPMGRKQAALGLSDLLGDILVYGIKYAGMGGVNDVQPEYPLGNSLIFPNTFQVYTNVDQYMGLADESDFLAREQLDWDNNPSVYTVYDINDPSTTNSVLSMQIRFQDAGETITEYSGIDPDDRDAPRQQRIYLPGDIPNQLLPNDIPIGSTISRIRGYPNGSMLQRILVDFVSYDGNAMPPKEFPNSSNRLVLVHHGMGTTSGVQGRVIPQSDGASEGYIMVSELPAEYNGSHEAFIQDVMEARMMERASNLNTTLSTGDVRGVRQLVWREGGAYNILVPNPDNPDEMILINMVLEGSMQ